MTRYAKRVDTTQPAMVDDLRKAGATVLHMHELGKGKPDLAVGIWDVTALVECKSPRKVSHAAGDGLSDAQREQMAAWKGGPWIRAETAEDVLQAIQKWARG